MAAHIKRRRGVGPNAWHVARALALVAGGTAYVVTMLTGLALVASWAGVR